MDEWIVGVELTFKLTIWLQLNLHLIERVSNILAPRNSHQAVLVHLLCQYLVQQKCIVYSVLLNLNRPSLRLLAPPKVERVNPKSIHSFCTWLLSCLEWNTVDIFVKCDNNACINCWQDKWHACGWNWGCFCWLWGGQRHWWQRGL